MIAESSSHRDSSQASLIKPLYCKKKKKKKNRRLLESAVFSKINHIQSDPPKKNPCPFVEAIWVLFFLGGRSQSKTTSRCLHNLTVPGGHQTKRKQNENRKRKKEIYIYIYMCVCVCVCVCV